MVAYQQSGELVSRCRNGVCVLDIHIHYSLRAYPFEEQPLAGVPSTPRRQR